MPQMLDTPMPTAPSEYVETLTLEDIQSDPLTKIADQHFGKKVQWKPEVIEKIVEKELEPSNFSTRKLAVLEHHQYLEKYLWPHYDENASINHTVSVCLAVNEKVRQSIPAWDAFGEGDQKFSLFFKRVTHLIVENDLSIFLTRQLLIFLINSFQNLEISFIRTECLKFFTIGIWSHLAHQSKREQYFADYPNLQKLWNTSNKKLVAADDETRIQLEFERDWLSAFLRKFIDYIYKIPFEGEVDEEVVKISERCLEFLIDLEAQLPTRRFFNALLEDHEIIVLLQMAPFARREDKDVDLLKKLTENLDFYSKFEINDQTGVALTDLEMTDAHCQQLIKLQHTVFRHFKDEIKELPLANLASIETRKDLLWHLKPLSEETLTRLCNMVGLRSQPLDITIDVELKEFLINVIIDKYQKHDSQVKRINYQPLYPDEEHLFNDNLIQKQTYTGDRPLALPKLNLQFLTLRDYLLRNFTLFKLESSYQIRQDIEDAVKRLAPRLTYPDYKTEFAGWARMAVPIEDFTIADIGEANLGESKPSRVLADVSYSISHYAPTIRGEWDELRKHDVLFLLTIEASENTANPLKEGEDFREHYGIKYIRGCEIVDVVGNDGRPIDEITRFNQGDNLAKLKGTRRTLRVALDTDQYKIDMDKVHSKKTGEIYQTFNLLVRRSSLENNFKAVLETVRDLIQSDSSLPDWLQKVFLGYGDPSSIIYKNMPNRERTIDMHDTFLDWDHLTSCFEGKKLQVDGEAPLDPPYTITLLDDPSNEPVKKSKKSKKSAAPVEAKPESLEVSSYKLPNKGPYAQETKKNQIRFTPSQAECIYAGVNYGLTLVVGDQDEGVTDVTVQTIANLYHSYPEQRTLILTHGNLSLNRIVERILELDIDAKHIARLGHGVENLKSEMNFSKYGRVAASLEKRLQLLSEVDRLSQSLNIPGEHGSTCETAYYFFNVHIQPRWENFLQSVQDADSVEKIRDLFPFAQFFANAPKAVFIDAMSKEEAIDAATGCYTHLQNMFSELEEIRPYELLRSGADRANYFLTKEAKIVAMTCTHAALKRRELVDLKFKYDNVIIAEASEILEIETFIPLLLQISEDNKSQIKRIVLAGDDSQSPSIVKNSSFQQYGNMKQSMFARLLRLGVPSLQLQ